MIDLADRLVRPGLIDCHTHLTGEYTADIRLRRVEETDADSAIRGVVYARRTLEAGFTTVRNVGSSGDAASTCPVSRHPSRRLPCPLSGWSCRS